MVKKFFIFIGVFALFSAAFLVYQWVDPSPAPPPQDPVTAVPIHSILATQPTSRPVAAIEYRGAEIQPGDAPRIRVFNPDGEARIVFQGTTWWPLSDSEFQVTQPTARVLLPGGQLAYVRADMGQIVFQRDDRNNYNPKRGQLTGNVQLFIDRTKPEWRKANPELAEPEDHPEAVVKIWMDDVSFDLDLARLETDGPIKVQGVDGTVEGRGLTLIWNEANRRVKLLRIAEGKRAVVQMKGLTSLGIGVDDPQAAGAAASGAAVTDWQEAMQAQSIQAELESARPVQAAQAGDTNTSQEDRTRIRLSDLNDLEEPIDQNRIDTYHIVFRDQIVAEQRQGLRVVGRMKADVLELLRDFGSEERLAVEHAPVTRSKPAAAPGPVAPAPADRPTPSGAGPAGGMVKQDATLELRWSGELVVTPVASTDEETAEGNRFQVIAQGNPVVLHDRDAGDATCRRLEYHEQSQAVWLFGDPDLWVTLQADADRQLSGERVFLDRKNGVARVEGPGRMTDLNADEADKQKWPQCIKDELAKHARSNPAAARKDDSDQMTITWKQGVEVFFAVAQEGAASPMRGTPGLGQGKEYLKSAVFRGEVAFDQPGQSMQADQIDITFSPPKAEPAPTERGVAAETLLAVGNVRMTNDESVISCDRLEVDMTTDDVGRNVPRVGRASGNVVARQGKQEIRAADQMIVMLESLPKPVTQEERDRLEAAAKACDYTAESPEWQQVETRLASRRRMLVRTLNARGDVTVRDPGESVDVAAEVLDCAFDDEQQISRALVMGSRDVPAHVSMSDFYIRGPQINFRLSDQTAEVPGAGILRFFTKQDLSGRRVDEAVPVVVTWTDRMSFRGQMNTGLFSGSVRAVSEGTILDCRELTLRFENIPEERSEPGLQASGPDSRWIAGPVIDLLKDRDERKSQASAASLSRGIRKRLVHLHAIGDAVIASSEYDKPVHQMGPFSAIMAGIMPDVLVQPQQPPAQEAQRLLSFVRINGPRITADLDNEHMVVEGAGHLLVLDYRPPAARSASNAPAGSTGVESSVAGSLRGGGPSQTVFAWQNSMSYLNRRNVAVLDNKVVMKHVAGSEVAMPEQVAAAMKVDVRNLTAAKSRRAELTCENLVVEFARNRAREGQGQASLSSATELKSFQASHRVRMQENSRAVEGELVTYDSGAGLVRIQGSPQLPAWIADIDEKTGAVPGSWRGQELEWNLNTGVVKVTGASIMAPGR